MAAPVFVTVTKETAVKVATAVTTGQVRKSKTGGSGAVWLATYVPTGDPAPDEADFRGGKVFVNADSFAIQASEFIDVYLWLKASEDGEVRVDV
jgi:hypothetical protein